MVAYSRGRRAGIYISIPDQDFELFDCLRGLQGQGGLRRTHAWEFDTAVTALRRAAALLKMLVLELSARGFDDANFVGSGVVPVRRREESVMAIFVGHLGDKGHVGDVELGVLRIPPALFRTLRQLALNLRMHTKVLTYVNLVVMVR